MIRPRIIKTLMILSPSLVNTDIKAAFQEMCRQASFDTLTGKATQPYDDGRVQPGDDIPIIKELRLFLGYFSVMHSTASNNRYYDNRGHTHHVKSTPGGQQGEPVPGDHAL
jgi:hypothetical protein